MFAGLDSPSHILIIAVLAAALFGYKRLPDAAHSIGRSLRVFRSEVRGLAGDPTDEALSPPTDHTNPSISEEAE